MEPSRGMRLSRRKLIGALGVAAVAPWGTRAGAPLRLIRGVAGTGKGSFDALTLARFAPQVGTRFTLRHAGARPVGVKLEEAVAGVSHPADPRGLQGESFSLLFRADGPAALTDGIHDVVHPALGTVPIFLVAVGRGGQGYEAVVDRRLPGR